MNQMFKKASSVFTAIVCAASITFSGASLVLADGEIDEQTKTTIETTAEGLTNTIIPLTEDEIAAYMESGDAFTENAMTAWDSAREELGDLKKAGSAVELMGGLRSGMGYCGAETIEKLKTTGRFIKISAASLKESHPHDIHITKEAPNYSVDE